MGEAKNIYFTCLKLIFSCVATKKGGGISTEMSITRRFTLLNSLLRHSRKSPSSGKLSDIVALPYGGSAPSAFPLGSVSIASTLQRHSSTKTENIFSKSQVQRDAEEAIKFADGERDIPEARRVAEIREQIVKEHKAKVAKSRFNFDVVPYVVGVTVGFIVVDLLGLNFWEGLDLWGGIERRP